MVELSAVWSIGETPMRGCIPSVRGPKLPRPSWHGRRDDLVFVLGYLAGVAQLIEVAKARRRGPFDLRAESIDLTAEHTLARIHRGAA